MSARRNGFRTPAEQRRLHMGCDIGFVVLAPFALAEKCMQGEVEASKSHHNISACEKINKKKQQKNMRMYV